MDNKLIDSYTIGLDVVQSDKTRKTIIDLREAFEDTDKSLEDINKQLLEAVQGQEDATAEAKAYNSLLGKRITALNKEAELIQSSQSAQGKADRERLQMLKRESASRQLTKSELKEIEKLESRVLDLSDEELENKLKQNQADRVRLKTMQLEMKEKLKQVKIQKTFKDLIKADLTAMTARIKKQYDFIKSLSKTERAYLAIKKAGGLAIKGAKLGGKAAAGAIGIAGALVGGAISSAENITQKEAEAGRIKIGGLSKDEKYALIGRLQIATGKDATTIVDAINRVSNVVKTGNARQIQSMAEAELKFPGLASMFQGASGTQASDFTILANRLMAMQGVTGSSASDLSTIMKTVEGYRDSAFKNGISQQDLLALGSFIQGSGAFDDNAQAERAMRSFLAQGGLTSENFYDKMAEFSWEKFTRGSQNINQALAAKRNFDFNALKKASGITNTTLEKSAAEKAAEVARTLSIKKDEIFLKILEKINVNEFVSLIDSLFELASKTLPLFIKMVAPILEKIVKFTNMIIRAASESHTLSGFFASIRDIQTEEIREQMQRDREAHNELMAKRQAELDALKAQNALNRGDLPKLLEKIARFALDNNTGNITQKAQGGIATSPTLVGERGAEAIIPLDYSRSGRATSILQNISQTFNMGGSQTTALSLGQAVKQRSFTDAYLSRRLYGV